MTGLAPNARWDLSLPLVFIGQIIVHAQEIYVTFHLVPIITVELGLTEEPGGVRYIAGVVMVIINVGDREQLDTSM